MSRGIPRQILQIPLAAGLSQKSDVRAMEPPGLSVLLDGQFDETGGLQTRLPYTALSNEIHEWDGEGSSTLTDIRKVVSHGDELLCFTKNALYSWNGKVSKWVKRSNYLAVATTEKSVFVTNGDQSQAARASLLGTTVYAWMEWVAETTAHRRVYVAAVDDATGHVVVSPTQMATVSGTAWKPRLIALDTRILLLYAEGEGLYAKAIDPASPGAGIVSAATQVVANPPFSPYYDAEKIPGSNSLAFACLAAGSTYIYGTVTAALAVTTVAKARTADETIALAVTPNGSHVQIARSSTTNIQGDYLTIAGADVTTGQALGTVATDVDNITIAYKSTAVLGVYTAHVFFTEDESPGATTFRFKTNTVATDGTIGTQSTMFYQTGLASKAFNHDNRVYVWSVFAGESSFSGATPSRVRAQLQNTYFLYRDDGLLVGKAATGVAGGLLAGLDERHLPNVQSLGNSAYALPGVERRIIDLSDTTATSAARVTRGYADRGPRDILFNFDSDEARRVASIGSTLYITGAEVVQYDGEGINEVGFHVYPWYFGAVEVGTGNLADGTYAYKLTNQWQNAYGETDRGTSSIAGEVTIAGGPNGVSIATAMPLFHTHKKSSPPSALVWRTAVDPTDEAPFYLTTSLDPTVTSNPNRYLPNDHTTNSLATFNDEFSDATLTTKQADPENGQLLEYLAPPPAKIIAATSDRLFLAGIADNPHQVYYSRIRRAGEVASFHDALTFDIPRNGGDITALAFLNETLIVFKESAVYALPGDGYDNFGSGQNYGPARLLSSDIGAESAEAIGVAPMGILFKSRKGWHLLGRGMDVQYIGGGVADYDSEVVKSIVVSTNQHQVRCLTASRMLIWDYLVGQWAEWSRAGTGSCIWQNTHAIAGTTSVVSLATSHTTGVDYGLDVETGWIKTNGLMGFGRGRWIHILGEQRSPAKLRVRLAYDYDETWVDDKVWAIVDGVGGSFELSHSPRIQRFKAIKIRLTAITAAQDAPDDYSPPDQEGIALTGVALEYGVYNGLYRKLPSTAKQ